MRIKDLLTESEKLDELGLADVGRGIGKAVGGVAKAAGSIPGAVAGAADAFKQGYQGTKATVSGKPQPNAPSASGGGTARPSGTSGPQGTGAGGAPEANDQQAKVGVGQINKIIPTLRTRDLQSVKKAVDAAIAAKARPAPAAGAPSPASAPAPTGSPAPAPTGGSRTRGQEVDLGGKKYRWAGAQWVDVASGRVADRATAAQLNNSPVAESRKKR